MKKLCIVIGAGASMDAASEILVQDHRVDIDWQPPVTDALFEPRASFSEILSHHQTRVQGLISYLRNRLAIRVSNAQPNTSLEKELGLVYRSKNFDQKQELKYLTYYLWDLFKEISMRYLKSGPSNYDYLVRAVLSRDIEVMFLVLNYDLFLEDSLKKLRTGLQFSKKGDYMPEGERWRLIKLHGSVNWGKKLIKPVNTGFGLPSREIDNLDLGLGLEQEITFVHLTGSTRHVPEGSGQSLYPVLAVPVEEKYDFLCPSEHIEEAKRFLGQCGNFLVVGCSLKDGSIRDLFRNNVRVARMLMIVNGNPQASSMALGELQMMPAFNGGKVWPESAYGGGFNEFLSNGELEKFLDSIQ